MDLLPNTFLLGSWMVFSPSTSFLLKLLSEIMEGCLFHNSSKFISSQTFSAVIGIKNQHIHLKEFFQNYLWHEGQLIFQGSSIKFILNRFEPLYEVEFLWWSVSSDWGFLILVIFWWILYFWYRWLIELGASHRLCICWYQHRGITIHWILMWLHRR